MKRDSIQGFSLVEVVAALALLALFGLGLLVLLLGSIGQTRDLRGETLGLLLARQIRTRLQDPRWPASRQEASSGWKSTLFYNSEAQLVDGPENASLRVELISGHGLGFDSPKLEAVSARILEHPSGREIDGYVFQRALGSQ